MVRDHLRCLDGPFLDTRGSHVWCLCKETTHLIQGCLSWVARNRKAIQLLEDIILGCSPLAQESYLLDIKNWLASQGISTLYDLSNWEASGARRWIGWKPLLPLNNIRD
jgi:hypothetical protein